VNDANRVEKSLHDAFGDHRVNPKREFFRINPERVLAILKLVEIQDVTPLTDVVEDKVEQDSLNRERNRRESFRFSMVGISPGTQLNFIRDESITAIVHDNRSIQWNGYTKSSSDAALEILRKKFGYRGRTVRGPRYWAYEGRALSEIREEMEQNKVVDE
jgi:hypothetical protein